MTHTAYNKIIGLDRVSALSQSLPPSGAGAGLGKSGPGGVWAGVAEPRPRLKLWEAWSASEGPAGVPGRGYPPESASEPLSRSEGHGLWARCATLVLRASLALERGIRRDDEERETGAMSEWLRKSRRTGRHAASKVSRAEKSLRRKLSGTLAVTGGVIGTLLVVALI